MQTWNMGFGAGHGEPGNENVVYLKVFRELSTKSLSTKKVLQQLVDSWLLGQLGQRVHYWLVRQLCGRQAAIHTTTGHRRQDTGHRSHQLDTGLGTTEYLSVYVNWTNTSTNIETAMVSRDHQPDKSWPRPPHMVALSFSSKELGIV